MSIKKNNNNPKESPYLTKNLYQCNIARRINGTPKGVRLSEKIEVNYNAL